MKEYKVIVDNNSQAWYLNGKLHREDGPAIISGDYQEWYLNGKLHREDGPAFISGDYQAWYLNGKRHREDGPAYIEGDYQEWWLNGEQVTEQEFNKRTKVKEMTMEELTKVLGDTNSVLGATIAAKRCGVPVYHMEAGNRCFDENVPEEINRKMIDHISDVHLPYTQNSKQYLIQEGINPSKIFVTGNPIYEVICKNLDEKGFKEDQIKDYMLATIHRNENTNTKEKIYNIFNFLNKIGKNFNLPVMLSIHPRIKDYHDEYGERFPWVKGFTPTNSKEFLYMETNAKCVFTDSGTVQEETTILEVPCVTIRNTTERPETIECGSNVIFNDLKDIDRGISIVKFQLLNKTWDDPIDYNEMFVSEKIVKLLLGNY